MEDKSNDCPQRNVWPHLEREFVTRWLGMGRAGLLTQCAEARDTHPAQVSTTLPRGQLRWGEKVWREMMSPTQGLAADSWLMTAQLTVLFLFLYKLLRLE
jgi:hypothetical protein